MKRLWLLALPLLLLSTSLRAALVTQEITYQVDGKEFTGYLAYDDAFSGKRPGVLVVHEWWGHNPYARNRAEMLARLGYTAFALDMYGSGKLAAHPKDAKAFMQALVSDLPQAEKRFTTALGLLRGQPTVDAEKTAAIGYCMGGGLVLHMARAGIDLKGVASFHGSIGMGGMDAKPGSVKAKVQVFTGAADPFVPVESVQEFVAKSTAAQMQFDLVSYPGVKHSFTNPEADNFGQQFNMPLAYDAAADADSWARMQTFFNEIFK